MRLLEFGKYKGKSFEWIFFNVPWYAQWLHTEDVEGRWTWHNQDDEVYFTELYRRASHLTGLCPWCKQRMLTRMCLTTHHGSGRLGAVSFDCDECEYLGGSPTSYHIPSFFAPYRMPRTEQKMIVDAIKSKFVGDGRLTQKKLEEFFQTDRFFPGATPGFFDHVHEIEEGQPCRPPKLVVMHI